MTLERRIEEPCIESHVLTRNDGLIKDAAVGNLLPENLGVFGIRPGFLRVAVDFQCLWVSVLRPFHLDLGVDHPLYPIRIQPDDGDLDDVVDIRVEASGFGVHPYEGLGVEGSVSSGHRVLRE